MSSSSCDVGTGAMSFHVNFILAVCVVCGKKGGASHKLKSTMYRNFSFNAKLKLSAGFV